MVKKPNQSPKTPKSMKKIVVSLGVVKIVCLAEWESSLVVILVPHPTNPCQYCALSAFSI